VPRQVRSVAVPPAAVSPKKSLVAAVARPALHTIHATSACAARWTMLFSIARARRYGVSDPRPRQNPLFNPNVTTGYVKGAITLVRKVQVMSTISLFPIPESTRCTTLL
jgi:hypothetical protein